MHVQIIRCQLTHASEEEYVVLSTDLSSTFVGVTGRISKIWLLDSSAGTWCIDYLKDCDAMEVFANPDLYNPVPTNRDLVNLTPTDDVLMKESVGIAHGLAGFNRYRPVCCTDEEPFPNKEVRYE